MAVFATRGRRRATAGAVPLTLLLHASLGARDAAGPEAAVVRDSAGTQIVENAASALEWAARWSIAAEPSVRWT